MLNDRDYTLILDKSGSMSTKDQPGGRSRWAAARESAQALAVKCEELDADGLTLYVFGSRFRRYENVTSDRVLQVFTENEPSGGTDLAGVLSHAFGSYFERRAKGGGPVRGPDAVFSYTRMMRFMAPPLELLRTPVGGALRTVVRLATPVADPVFDLYVRLLGFADRDVLGHPQFKAMFLHDLLTAENLRSAAHDLALFSRHWGFQLDEVTVPVVVWHGLSDVIVPPSHGHHQAARLVRGELRVRPGAGHFAGFAEVAEVLGRIREIWGDQTAEPVPVVPSARRRPRRSADD